jgi:hypothetical protein
VKNRERHRKHRQCPGLSKVQKSTTYVAGSLDLEATYDHGAGNGVKECHWNSVR